MLVWAVWCYPDTCLELSKVIWSWAVFPDVAPLSGAQPNSRYHQWAVTVKFMMLTSGMCRLDLIHCLATVGVHTTHMF